ncbi:MAG: hypothetical protein Q7W30_08345 [Coriobacteriia bacterium]|nr:hypothetical protein [Coriobacteriia bacterium]
MPGLKVHIHLTAQWATEEGLDPVEARAVAQADVSVDRLWPGSKKWGRHFNPSASLYYAPTELRRAIALAKAGERTAALEHLGYSLHSAQDAVGHGRLGQKHLLQTWGLTSINPDEWEPMSASVKRRIEAATRRIVRRFVSASS